MKIFIYWNRIDNDSKKIYKFLKKDSFREELESKNEVYYHEPYISFQIDKSILEKIASSDVKCRTKRIMWPKRIRATRVTASYIDLVCKRRNRH